MEHPGWLLDVATVQAANHIGTCWGTRGNFCDPPIPFLLIGAVPVVLLSER
jgi:hypothetical protein